MFRFQAGLLGLAADFTGKFSPWQGVHIQPLAGGVAVTASINGAMALIGYDAGGIASDGPATYLVGPELAKAANFVKTCERELLIDDDVAIVRNHFKEHTTSAEFPITRSKANFPDIAGAVSAALRRWGELPEVSSTAGRYDSELLLKAIRAVRDKTDNLVISGYDGGPLRLQGGRMDVVILLMPQAAEPIPPPPPWLADYAASGRPALAS